jgi:hypothetical protein
MSESASIRRVTGTKYPNMVCKFCAHGKTWHHNEGRCRIEDCDCEAWDYGVNVASTEEET